MERLTLKELAPYLPFKLKVKTRVGGKILEMMSLSTVTHKGQICIETYGGNFGDMWFKPLLRPLSSFNGYFSKLFDKDVDVRTFLNEGFITQENQFSDLDDMLFNYKIEWWPYGVIQLALKNHFDIHGLIDRGLALPIDRKEVEGE